MYNIIVEENGTIVQFDFSDIVTAKSKVRYCLYNNINPRYIKILESDNKGQVIANITNKVISELKNERNYTLYVKNKTPILYNNYQEVLVKYIDHRKGGFDAPSVTIIEEDIYGVKSDISHKAETYFLNNKSNFTSEPGDCIGCSKCEYSRYEFSGFTCSKGHTKEYKYIANVWCDDYEYMKAPF